MLLLAASPGFAQAGGLTGDLLPAELIDGLTAATRASLEQVRLADGSSLPPESAEERAQPIVPRDLEVQTINRAVLSARLHVCGEDYVSLSYMPYMRRLQTAGSYSTRQLAYLGMLHGATVRAIGRPPEGQSPDCGEAAIAELKRQAAAQ